ncbi:MAG: prephenate dehydratase [Actinomycetaceae bacterium]|nr:prephenate dehydratase [Actinomycetaceae bacterium]
MNDHHTCCEHPQPRRYAFLGPYGTFCHQALTQFVNGKAELIPCAGERVAMDMVREGKAHRAVVPIENTVEGGVTATMDSLANDKRLMILRETTVPVAFTLAVKQGVAREDITAIGTHPHAWAQCRNWIADHLPGVEHVRTASTASAATLLSEQADPGFQAVLSSAVAVKLCGLDILEADVADNPGAHTRFVELGLPCHVGEPTGADRTTIQVYLPPDRPGLLLTMLEQFSVRGVNLTRIESRPVAGSVGRYSFNIDIDGHIREERVQAALVGLYRTCEDLRFLGSYPKADKQPNFIDVDCHDNDFTQASQWVRSILNYD